MGWVVFGGVVVGGSGLFWVRRGFDVFFFFRRLFL